MAENGELTDIFDTGDIFANRELVRVGHVPELDRVVGRDEEIRSVGSALAAATEGGPPETTIIYGKTGTGKSLVSRCVTRQASRRAANNGTALEYAYVDCSDYQTETQASRELARELNENLEAGESIPQTGLSAVDYRDITWDLLSNHAVDSLVVILDEIDKLENEDLLRSLSRARESGKSDTFIGVICISNKIEYRERLNERVDSSLQDNELVFDPYGAKQLRAILENRKDAFKPDVLSDEVIPKTAALAAREHGDARKAVETFYEAGRLAEKNGDGQVTDAHVDEAITQAEVNRFHRLVSGQTPHVKYILRALAALTASEEKKQFRTAKIYDLYTTIATQEGSDPLSHDRVRRLLKEQAFLGITESEHTGGGDREGSYLVHRLMRDPDIVFNALNADRSP
ncbi:cell division control protein Cdc6 [Haloterrigena sp. H1]|uniref:Cdc6/Cdc18 family protein n=1 Tax=Haloterrigena sp. H1 TaxID=2552943 RepID=UPI00110D5645|nr:AAA family ATPase [Haloterrigena sp. H1]TMT85459.1 cell division control protein Cdc6 [Haloterrigena sp. H1]